MARINLLDPKTCTQVGLGTNIVLTIFKLLAGIFGRSYAMVADGLHSLSDILATGIVYIGICIGARPADEDHPYGHENAETIAAFLVALIVFVTGIYAGVSAILAIVHKELRIPSAIALLAAAVSIILKEGLFRYTIKVGEKSNNPAIISNSWEHRSDAYSSVASLIGIAGARLAFPLLDPLAGLVVSVFILKISIHLIRSNIGILMDERPNPIILNNIKTVIRDIKEVKNIDSIKVHPRGSSFTIDIEIAIDSHLTVEEGHRIAVMVRKKLFKEVRYIREVMVHVHPYHIK